MASYRMTRNIEASVVDYLTAQFVRGGWTNITVEKTFKRIYGLPMDINKGAAAICVRVLRSTIIKAEIGDNAIWRKAQVMIDVFATSDGQREDLKDFIIDVFKYGCPYNQYTVTSGVASNTVAGRLRVLSIEDTPVNFNTDKSALEVADRYRHALTFSVTTGQVEE